jgi:hypothetical protein
MIGKRYYITTLGAWRAHASRFANSHFILLDAPQAASTAAEADAPQASPAASTSASREGNCSPAHAPDSPDKRTPDDAVPILVLIEADEGAHLALEDEPAFEALPHPLAQKPISAAAQSALAAHGVAPGATTFDAAEAVARVHPLLRHRVF